MSHPDPMNDPENTLPTDDRYETREEELAAIEKEDSATEQFLEDQRL